MAALTGLARTPYLQDARESQIAEWLALAESCCLAATLCRQGPLFAAFACSDAWVASVLWGVFTDATDVSSF